MKAKNWIFFTFALCVFSGFGGSQEMVQNEDGSRQEQGEKTAKNTEGEEKEKTKLFQLDAVEIEVVEYIRDIEIPNMTVVKPELFPMSMGTTLDTALERQPGVDIQRIQEIGTATDDDSIKIRGLGSRRIKVTKNGRALNTSGVAGGYFIDWTLIPLTNIDRVEVVKGVADPRYASVLGGVINLVPRRLPSEAALTEVQVSTASHDSSTLNLFHGYKPGALEYSLAVGAAKSDGYLKNGSLSFGNVDFHIGYDFSFRGRFSADIAYNQIKKGFVVANRISHDPDDPDSIRPSILIIRLPTVNTCTEEWERIRIRAASGKRKNGCSILAMSRPSAISASSISDTGRIMATGKPITTACH